MDAPTANAPASRPWHEGLLALCARETSSGRFIPQIDGLRSLAVLAVVFFHLDEQMGQPAVSDSVSRAVTSAVRRGFLGVPIFFAISAFIVALPFAQRWLYAGKPVEIGRFYLRRLTRLEPPYFFNLIALWLLGALLGQWALSDQFKGLLASLAYQHNQLFGYFSTINSVAWSLEVEFQFYLLAPLLTLVFALRQQWARWLLLAAVVASLVGLRDISNRRVELSLLGQFEAFAAGLIVVDVFLTRWQGRLPGRAVWDVVAVLGWLGFFGLSRLSDPAVRSLSQTLCLIAAMLGSLGGVWLARIFGNRWVFTFGGMCYSFYLWHQWLLIWLVPKVQSWTGSSGNYTLRFLITAALTLPLVFLVCTALFILLEKPFMRRDWPQRLTGWLRRRTGRS
jgi:peptidoglycan/LPS O-acetylase OafA/YrhL